MPNPPQSDVVTSDWHTLGFAKGMQWLLSTQHIVLGVWVDSIASHRLAMAWSAQGAMSAHHQNHSSEICLKLKNSEITKNQKQFSIVKRI
jgi:hypothetical protein